MMNKVEQNTVLPPNKQNDLANLSEYAITQLKEIDQKALETMILNAQLFYNKGLKLTQQLEPKVPRFVKPYRVYTRGKYSTVIFHNNKYTRLGIDDPIDKYVSIAQSNKTVQHTEWIQIFPQIKAIITNIVENNIKMQKFVRPMMVGIMVTSLLNIITSVVGAWFAENTVSRACHVGSLICAIVTGTLSILTFIKVKSTLESDEVKKIEDSVSKLIMYSLAANSTDIHFDKKRYTKILDRSTIGEVGSSLLEDEFEVKIDRDAETDENEKKFYSKMKQHIACFDVSEEQEAKFLTQARLAPPDDIRIKYYKLITAKLDPEDKTKFIIPTTSLVSNSSHIDLVKLLWGVREGKCVELPRDYTEKRVEELYEKAKNIKMSEAFKKDLEAAKQKINTAAFNNGERLDDKFETFAGNGHLEKLIYCVTREPQYVTAEVMNIFVKIFGFPVLIYTGNYKKLPYSLHKPPSIALKYDSENKKWYRYTTLCPFNAQTKMSIAEFKLQLLIMMKTTFIGYCNNVFPFQSGDLKNDKRETQYLLTSFARKYDSLTTPQFSVQQAFDSEKFLQEGLIKGFKSGIGVLVLAVTSAFVPSKKGNVDLSFVDRLNEGSRLLDSIGKTTSRGNDLVDQLALDIFGLQLSQNSVLKSKLLEQFEKIEEYRRRPKAYFHGNYKNLAKYDRLVNSTEKLLFTLNIKGKDSDKALDQIVTSLRISLAESKEYIKKIEEMQSSHMTRTETLGFCMIGVPGEGKTTVCQERILPQVMRRMGWNGMLKLDLTDKTYFPILSGEEVIIYDEFLNTMENDPLVRVIGKMCSSGHCGMPSADVSGKMQKCDAKLFVGISNVACVNTMKNVLNVGAIESFWDKLLSIYYVNRISRPGQLRHDKVIVTEWDPYKEEFRYYMNGASPAYDGIGSLWCERLATKVSNTPDHIIEKLYDPESDTFKQEPIQDPDCQGKTYTLLSQKQLVEMLIRQLHEKKARYELAMREFHKGQLIKCIKDGMTKEQVIEMANDMGADAILIEGVEEIMTQTISEMQADNEEQEQQELQAKIDEFIREDDELFPNMYDRSNFSVLFTGPPGTGKTEAARKLANTLSKLFHLQVYEVPNFDNPPIITKPSIIMTHDLIYDQTRYIHFYDQQPPGSVFINTANIHIKYKEGSWWDPSTLFLKTHIYSDNQQVGSIKAPDFLSRVITKAVEWIPSPATFTTVNMKKYHQISIDQPGFMRRIGVPGMHWHAGEISHVNEDLAHHYESSQGYLITDIANRKLVVVPEVIITIASKLGKFFNQPYGIEIRKHDSKEEVAEMVEDPTVHIKAKSLIDLKEMVNSAYNVQKYFNNEKDGRYVGISRFLLSNATTLLSHEPFKIPDKIDNNTVKDVAMRCYSYLTKMNSKYTCYVEVGSYAVWCKDYICHVTGFDNRSNHIDIQIVGEHVTFKNELNEGLKIHIKTYAKWMNTNYDTDLLSTKFTYEEIQSILLQEKLMRKNKILAPLILTNGLRTEVRSDMSRKWQDFKIMFSEFMQKPWWVIITFLLGLIASATIFVSIIKLIIGYFRTNKSKTWLNINGLEVGVEITKTKGVITCAIYPPANCPIDPGTLQMEVLRILESGRKYEIFGDQARLWDPRTTEVHNIVMVTTADQVQSKTTLYDSLKVMKPLDTTRRINRVHTDDRQQAGDSGLQPSILEEVRKHVEKAMCRVHLAKDNASGLYGLRIKGQFILTPAHVAIDTYTGKIAHRWLYATLRNRGEIQTKRIKLYSYDYNQDMALWEITEPCENAKDITKYFIKEREKGTIFRSMLVKPVSLERESFSYYNGNSTHVINNLDYKCTQQGYHAGLQNYINDFFEHGMGITGPGDCGSLYLKMNTGNERIVIGQHIIAMSNGLLRSSCITQEILNDLFQVRDTVQANTRCVKSVAQIGVKYQYGPLQEFYCHPDTYVLFNGMNISSVPGPSERLMRSHHFGFLGRNPALRNPWESKEREKRSLTPWINEIIKYVPIEKAPAIQDVNQVSDFSKLSLNSHGIPSIKLTQLDKICDPDPEPFAINYVKKAYSLVKPLYIEWYGKYKHRFCTDLEMINGLVIKDNDELFGHLQGINMDGSLSVEITRKYNITDRRRIFDLLPSKTKTGGDLYTFNEHPASREILATIYHTIQVWRKGKRYLELVVDRQKEELLKPEKVKYGLTRLYSRFSICNALAKRKVFGTILAAMEKNAYRAHSQIGLAPADFTALYYRLKRIGESGENGDFTAWDKHVNLDEAMVAAALWSDIFLFNHRNECPTCREKGQCEYDEAIRSIIKMGVDSAICYIGVCDGLIYCKDRGLGSGSTITTALNGTINELKAYAVIIWLLERYNENNPLAKIDITLENLRNMFDQITCGDDTAKAINPKYQHIINFETLKEGYDKMFHLNYDLPTKDGRIVPLVKLEDLSFCSRTFSRSNQFIYPKLKESSIVSLLHWTSEYSYEMYTQIFHTVLDEIRLHGREKYDLYKWLIEVKIVPFLQRNNPFYTYVVPEWEDKIKQFQDQIETARKCTIVAPPRLTSFDTKSETENNITVKFDKEIDFNDDDLEFFADDTQQANMNDENVPNWPEIFEILSKDKNLVPVRGFISTSDNSILRLDLALADESYRNSSLLTRKLQSIFGATPYRFKKADVFYDHPKEIWIGMCDIALPKRVSSDDWPVCTTDDVQQNATGITGKTEPKRDPRMPEDGYTLEERIFFQDMDNHAIDQMEILENQARRLNITVPAPYDRAAAIRDTNTLYNPEEIDIYIEYPTGDQNYDDCWLLNVYIPRYRFETMLYETEWPENPRILVDLRYTHPRFCIPPDWEIYKAMVNSPCRDMIEFEQNRRECSFMIPNEHSDINYSAFFVGEKMWLDENKTILLEGRNPMEKVFTALPFTRHLFWEGMENEWMNNHENCVYIDVDHPMFSDDDIFTISPAFTEVWFHDRLAFYRFHIFHNMLYRNPKLINTIIFGAKFIKQHYGLTMVISYDHVKFQRPSISDLDSPVILFKEPFPVRPCDHIVPWEGTEVEELTFDDEQQAMNPQDMKTTYGTQAANPADPNVYGPPMDLSVGNGIPIQLIDTEFAHLDVRGQAMIPKALRDITITPDTAVGAVIFNIGMDKLFNSFMLGACAYNDTWLGDMEVLIHVVGIPNMLGEVAIGITDKFIQTPKFSDIEMKPYITAKMDVSVRQHLMLRPHSMEHKLVTGFKFPPVADEMKKQPHLVCIVRSRVGTVYPNKDVANTIHIYTRLMPNLILRCNRPPAIGTPAQLILDSSSRSLTLPRGIYYTDGPFFAKKGFRYPVDTHMCKVSVTVLNSINIRLDGVEMTEKILSITKNTKFSDIVHVPDPQRNSWNTATVFAPIRDFSLMTNEDPGKNYIQLEGDMHAVVTVRQSPDARTMNNSFIRQGEIMDISGRIKSSRINFDYLSGLLNPNITIVYKAKDLAKPCYPGVVVEPMNDFKNTGLDDFGISKEDQELIQNLLKNAPNNSLQGVKPMVFGDCIQTIDLDFNFDKFRMKDMYVVKVSGQAIKDATKLPSGCCSLYYTSGAVPGVSIGLAANGGNPTWPFGEKIAEFFSRNFSSPGKRYKLDVVDEKFSEHVMTIYYDVDQEVVYMNPGFSGYMLLNADTNLIAVNITEVNKGGSNPIDLNKLWVERVVRNRPIRSTLPPLEFDDNQQAGIAAATIFGGLLGGVGQGLGAYGQAQINKEMQQLQIQHQTNLADKRIDADKLLQQNLLDFKNKYQLSDQSFRESVLTAQFGHERNLQTAQFGHDIDKMILQAQINGMNTPAARGQAFLKGGDWNPAAHLEGATTTASSTDNAIPPTEDLKEQNRGNVQFSENGTKVSPVVEAPVVKTQSKVKTE